MRGGGRPLGTFYPTPPRSAHGPWQSRSKQMVWTLSEGNAPEAAGVAREAGVGKGLETLEALLLALATWAAASQFITRQQGPGSPPRAAAGGRASAPEAGAQPRAQARGPAAGAPRASVSPRESGGGVTSENPLLSTAVRKREAAHPAGSRPAVISVLGAEPARPAGGSQGEGLQARFPAPAKA